ncbi:MAG: C25 family cysteine peptidase, partial [Thermoplasmatota archaeon]
YVPSRMVKDLDPYGNEPSTLPADTYFACLDGTYRNWNADGDANWGEQNDIQDYYPEVYVSRISLDSETEAKKWADKVVRYEKEVPVGSWAGTMAFFGSTTHYTDDGPQQSEYLWSKHGRYAYSSIDRYYSDGPTRSSTGAKLLTYSNIQTGFNDGLSAVVYMGHGIAQYWSEGTQENSHYLYDANVAANLAQAPRMPFITAMSCETNWFDGSGWEAISEGFTENPNGGAIAYVGASRTTEGGIGYDTYLPGAPGIQEDVLRMMANGYNTPAEIFHRAKAYYVEAFINYFAGNQFAYNAWMEHNLLGPPETLLWMNAPKSFSVSYTFDNDHYTNFTVQVRDGSNNAVQNARVTLYSQTLEQRGYAYTDAMGRAVVPFTITQTAYGKLTVTKEDFKPYQKEVLLRDQTPPETEPVCMVQNPNGANGWYVTDPGLILSSSEPADISFIWNGRFTETYRGGTMEVPMGDNILEFWGEDNSGNEEDVKTFRVRYDPEIPMAEITMTPVEPDGNSGWFITQPVLEVDLEPSMGSPQRVDYWWDRGQKQECNGTIYPPQGSSELHVQAVDEAGNKGPEFSYEFNVDSIVPVTTYETDGVEPNVRGWYTDPMTITLRSDDRRSYTYYRWGSEGDWNKYSSELIPPSGNHTLQFYSEDDHGNREELRSLLVPYDVMAPEVEVTTEPRSPDGASNWYSTKPRVELKVLFESNAYDIFYYFEGQELQRYISPIDVSEGIWTLYCYAEDEAGNRGILREMEFKVDLTPDSTSDYLDLSTNDEGWFTDLPQVILKTSEGSKIYYSWEGLTGFEQYYGSLYPPGDEGVFHLAYYSVDPAGNEESRKLLTLLVDTTGPVVSVEMQKSADAGEEISIDLSGTTDGIGVEYYFVDFGDGTDSGWTVKPVLTHKYTSGGNYEVRVKAKDGVGHESTETIVKLTVNDDMDSTMLALIIGGGALLIVIVLALLIVAVVRSRHHHYPHHGIHHHPLHPLQPVPVQRPGIQSGAQRALPPHKPAQPKAAAQQPQKTPAPKPPAAVSSVPQPPKRPEIPQPPKPPL